MSILIWMLGSVTERVGAPRGPSASWSRRVCKRWERLALWNLREVVVDFWPKVVIIPIIAPKMGGDLMGYHQSMVWLKSLGHPIDPGPSGAPRLLQRLCCVSSRGSSVCGSVDWQKYCHFEHETNMETNRKPMVILVDSPHNMKASNFCGDSFISHVMVKLLVVWAHSAGVSLCTSRCGAQPLPGLLIIHQIIQDCNRNHVHTRFVSFKDDDDKREVSFNIIHSTFAYICMFSGWL